MTKYLVPLPVKIPVHPPRRPTLGKALLLLKMGYVSEYLDFFFFLFPDDPSSAGIVSYPPRKTRIVDGPTRQRCRPGVVPFL